MISFGEQLKEMAKAKAKQMGLLKGQQLSPREVFELACDCDTARELERGKVIPVVAQQSPVKAQKRETDIHPDAEAIYAAYPYKKAPEDAKKAITQALRKHDAAYLLARTKLFAEAVRSWPSAYRFDQKSGRDLCPFPASWIRAGSFAEDENLWRRGGARKPAEHQYISPPEPAGWKAAFPDFTDRDKPWNQLHPSQHAYILKALELGQLASSILHEDAESTKLRTA